MNSSIDNGTTLAEYVPPYAVPTTATIILLALRKCFPRITNTYPQDMSSCAV